jgi:hypothetical protein
VLKSTDGGLTWNSGAWDRQYVATSVVVDPRTPSRLWAGTNLGLLKSEDGGATWKSTIWKASINALAIDPRNPSRMYLANAYLMYFSNDSGENWLPVFGQASLPAATINTIAVSPFNSSVLYAGLSGYYLYISPDGGFTWSQYPSWLYNVTQVAFDPQDPGLVYFAGSISRSPAPAVQVIEMAGSSSGILLETNAKINHFAVRHGSPSTIYAAIDGQGILRSTNNMFWEPLGDSRLVQTNSIWLDPRNPDRMIAGGSIATDAVVAKFSPDLSQLLFSTCHGGSAGDEARGVAIDAGGNILVVGATYSRDFPVTPNAVPPLGMGGYLSAFLFKLGEAPPPAEDPAPAAKARD